MAQLIANPIYMTIEDEMSIHFQNVNNSIKLLYSAGLTIEEIAAKLGIPVDKIQTIV